MIAADAAPQDPFVHPALFYGDEQDYLAGTVPFVRAALAAGEPVAVAVPAENLRIIQDGLGAEADAVRFLDMRQAGRNPGRIIPGVLRAFADAQPTGVPVRIIGEPIWAGRSPAEYPACVQHEALINAAFRGRTVTILCPYDTRHLPAQVIADAQATHPTLLLAGSARLRHSCAYAPEAVVARYNEPLPPAPDVPAFRFEADTLPEARHLATAEGVRLGLAPARVEDLALVTAELATNSVVHGGGWGSVRVWAEAGRTPTEDGQGRADDVQGGHVVVEVRDKGHLTDPLAGRRPASRAQRGGRGLLLVNLVADLVRLYTEPGGTTVRCWFSR